MDAYAHEFEFDPVAVKEEWVRLSARKHQN